MAIASFFILAYITLVTLDFYTRHGEALSVPDLSGLSVEEATKVLEETQLLAMVTDSLYLDEVPKGSIVDQYPKPENKVKVNRTILLTINAYGDEKIKMPDLKGLSLRIATGTAESFGLRIGELTFVPDIATNSVIEQKHNNKVIKKGTLINKGAVIDLEVGQGLSDEQTIVPNLGAFTYEEAKEQLSLLSLNLGGVVYDTLTVKTEEDSLNAQVFKQKPSFDNDKPIEVKLGSPIDIWLTTNQELIPEKAVNNFIPDSLINKIGEKQEL